ncbi:pentatricopeptide repeat-containing protein At1g04840 [Capsella rubella]|nr:pentatricopeptide repeat-containing protein At1g04840 [Capsella rubella]
MKSLSVLFKPKSSPAKIHLPADRRASPDESHFISLIHACKDTVSLRRVHAQILRRGVLSSRVAAQLVSCSGLLQSPDYCLSIFRNFEEKNLFVFNVLIRGLTENARSASSVRHFILMLRLGVRPDRLTFPFVLKSNSKLGFRWLGRALHAATLKNFVDCDSFVRVSLVDMYAKTRQLNYAFQVFDESPDRIKKESTLLSNVLIKGYCRAKDMQMATKLFRSMPERNSGSWSTLIKGYADCSQLNRAKQLFELMPEKHVVTWTTLINGFSQNGYYETAISTYFEMLEKGLKPNEYTVAAALSACSKSGALGSGIRIHAYILDNGIRLDRAIGTALIDMYAKCGEVDCAGTVFSNMNHKDILSWTAMIQGWAVHGCFHQAIQCFRQMMYSGEKPDEVVFLAVLTACLNSGEVDLGLNFFDSMRLDYAIEPTLKHYVLVVDLLGRAGKLNEAHKFVDNMPINPDFTTWAALYRASKAHRSNRRTEIVSQNLLELDPELRGSYIFLDKTHLANGKYQDVEERRVPYQKTGKERSLGWSYIELDCQLNKFAAGDCTHKQTQEIRLKLEEIISLATEIGYIPGADWSIHDIEEEEKEHVTGVHSEKLALTLGILRTAPGTTIRIIKNLRICGDCHSLMKYVSKISQRGILLRDARQFHHFKDGSCSCGDYW